MAKDDAGNLKTFGALRRRMFDTVFETRRLIDYCESRSDIDGGRIYLMGASFGAITGATAAAYDERIRACVLTYGGGNIRKLLSGPEISESLGFWGRLVKPLAIVLLRHADPVRHIHRLSPRPLLLQN